MPIHKPKSRMISIRLSDEEYVGLMQACLNNGWANVSEAARAAMRALGRGDVTKSAPVELQVQQLIGQMDFLSRRVEMLAEKIEGKMECVR